MVTECAFGQLKGRWRLLYRKSEVSQLSLKTSVLACTLLYNMCIEKNDHTNRSLDLTFDQSNNKKEIIRKY